MRTWFKVCAGILIFWGTILLWVPLAHAATWNQYGGGAGHSRVSPVKFFNGALVHHPYAITTPGLMEFPPSVDGGVAYAATDSGNVKAYVAATGEARWSTLIGGIAADSPAVAHGRVFVQSRPGRGQLSPSTGFVALSARTGALLWRLTGFTGESSPVLVGRNVCGAATDGRIGCWNQVTGRGVWRRKVPCKVTAALTLAQGMLWATCYKGWLFKINPKHGKLIWKRRGPGAVYANAVVSHGLVYVTYRDVGSVWAWSLTGVRRWATRIGGGADYSSPAVTPGAVYTTTRSGAGGRGTFVKLSAATGRVLWRATAPGLVMGSPVVVGSRVYFSAMGKHFTPGHIYGYHVSGMRRTFTFNTDGRYSPVVPAGHTLMLVGQTHIYGVR